MSTLLGEGWWLGRPIERLALAIWFPELGMASTSFWLKSGPCVSLGCRETCRILREEYLRMDALPPHVALSWLRHGMRVHFPETIEVSLRLHELERCWL